MSEVSNSADLCIYLCFPLTYHIDREDLTISIYGGKNMKFHQKNGQRYFAMFLSAVLTAGTMMAALIVPSASARVVDKYVGTFTYDFLKDGKSCYEAENVVDGYLDNDSFTYALRMNYEVDSEGMHFKSGRPTGATAVDSAHSGLWVKTDAPYGAFLVKDADYATADNPDGNVIIRKGYKYKITVNYKIESVDESNVTTVSIGLGQTTGGSIAGNDFKAFKSVRNNVDTANVTTDDATLTFEFIADESQYAANNEKLGIYAGYFGTANNMNSRARYLIKNVFVEVSKLSATAYDFIGADGTKIFDDKSDVSNGNWANFSRVNVVRTAHSTGENGFTVISGRSEEYQNGTMSAAYLVGDPDYLGTLGSRFVKMVAGKEYGVTVKYKLLNSGRGNADSTVLQEDPYANDPQLTLGLASLNSENRIDGALTVVAKDTINRDTGAPEGTDSDIILDGEWRYMSADIVADSAMAGKWLAISAGFKNAFNIIMNTDDCVQFLIEKVSVTVKDSTEKSLSRIAEYGFDGTLDIYHADSRYVIETGKYFADINSGAVYTEIPSSDASVMCVSKGSFVAAENVDNVVTYKEVECGTAPYLPQNRLGEGAMYWTDAGGSRITDWSAKGIRKIYVKYPTDAAAWDFSNGELDVYYTIQASKNASTTNSTYSFGSDATHKSFINIKDAGTASFRVELALSATPGAGKTDGYRVTAGKYAIQFSIKLSKKEEKGSLRFYLVDKNGIGQAGHKAGNIVIKNNITYNNGEWTTYNAEFTVPTITNCSTCENTPLDVLMLCYSFDGGKMATDISLADIKIKKIGDDTSIYSNAVGNAYSSIRGESGAGEDYVSAGLRFRAHLENDYLAKVNAADEAGFIIAPEKNTATEGWYDISNTSTGLIKSVAVKKPGMNEVIYDEGDGYKDYQLILTGLTKDGQQKSLKGTNFVSVFYIKTGDTYEYFYVRQGSYDTVKSAYTASGASVSNY